MCLMHGKITSKADQTFFPVLKLDLPISNILNALPATQREERTWRGGSRYNCVSGKGDERTNSNDNKKCSFLYCFLAPWTENRQMSSKLEEVYYEKAMFWFFVNYLICICKQNLCLKRKTV